MNYDNYYKNGGMTKEESVSAIALRIGAKKEAVAKFVEKHKIDTNKLNSDLKSGEVYFMDVITAIVGKPDNKYEKQIVKKYSIKMAMGGKTQGYDAREDERLGMEYGKMSGKDFDGSHNRREHSRRDDARFEERMAKGGELTYDDFMVGDFYSNSSEGGKFKFVGKDESGRLRFEDSKGINRIFSPKRMNKYADGGMMADGGEVEAKKRLEELREALRSEDMSYSELLDLQSLAKYIDKDDVELLEAAGVPEFDDDEPSEEMQKLLEEHEKEAKKNRVKITNLGSNSGDDYIASKTTQRKDGSDFLTSEINEGEVTHYWEEYGQGGMMADGGEIKVINLSDDDKLNYFIKKQELVEKQDREDDDYTFINDMLTTTYNGKKFYSLGYDTFDKGRVFSLEEAKKNARIITDSQLGQKWDVIIKEVGGAFGEQDFTKKQYVVMTSPLFPREMLREMRNTLRYADGGMMADGGKLRSYKTFVEEYPDKKIYVRVKFAGADKDVQHYTANEENKKRAIGFAKRLAEKNNGTYEGFKTYTLAKGGMMADGGYVNQYFGKGYEDDAITELKKALPNHKFEKGKNKIIVDGGKYIIYTDEGRNGIIRIYDNGEFSGGIGVERLSEAIEVIKKENLYDIGGIMANGGFVVVSENDGYWYIMSKPTSKQDAEEFLSTLTIPRGEVGKVVTLEEAKNHKKVIGRKYLKMADGGVMSDERDKDGMLYALQEHISSGEIANITNTLKYTDIDEIRTKAIQYYLENGDKPYSYAELESVLKKFDHTKMADGSGVIIAYANGDDNLKLGEFASRLEAKNFAKENKNRFKTITFEDDYGYKFVVYKDDTFKDLDNVFSNPYAKGGMMADGGMMDDENDDDDDERTRNNARFEVTLYDEDDKEYYTVRIAEDEDEAVRDAENYFGIESVDSSVNMITDYDGRNLFKDGGMMAKGGEIGSMIIYKGRKTKILDAYKDKAFGDRMVYRVNTPMYENIKNSPMTKTIITQDENGEYRKIERSDYVDKMASGGMMAKGGEIYKIQAKYKFDLQPKWEDEKFQTGGRYFLSFKQAQDFKKGLQGQSSSIEYKVVKVEEKMADGGMIYEVGIDNGKDGTRTLADFEKEKDAEKFMYDYNLTNPNAKLFIDTVTSDSGYMAKGGKITRNKNKNDYNSMFNFFIENNYQPIGKRDLIEMAYASSNGVDSAIPQSMVGDVDNTAFYVYDYQTDKMGELVDLRMKLKFSNVKVDVTIVQNGELKYGRHLPYELENATFHQALNYVFTHDDVEQFNIRPRKKFELGGAIEDQYEGRTPEDVWNNLTKDQKYHFIDDHALQIEMIKDENYDFNSDKFPESISNDLVKKSMRSDWEDLDEVIQNRFANHVRTGEYAKGGMMADGGEIVTIDGKKYKVKTINRINQDGINEPYDTYVPLYYDKKEKKSLTIGRQTDIPNVYNVAYEDGKNIMYSKKNIDFFIEKGLWKKMAKGGKVSYREAGENYEYVNTFGIEQRDFEKIVDAYHKSPSSDQIDRIDSRMTFNEMRTKYGREKVDEVGNYIHKTHQSHGKMADGGMMADGGAISEQNEMNKKVLALVQKANIDSKLEFGQLVVSALTDANAHSEVRKFISIIEKKPEWAEKPKEIDMNLPREEFKKQRAKTVYGSKYYDANEKINDLGIKIANMSGWEFETILDSLIFASEMSGRKDVAQVLEKLNTDDDIDYSKQTTDDFTLGEIVWDVDNERYGTVIVIYDKYASDKFELRLDSDGVQPTENLRKVGSKGDKGTKEQLNEAITSYARLVKEYGKYNDYPKQIKPDDSKDDDKPKNKWEYTDKDEIEYVVVKDKSGKELKFDGKDVISGVHDLLEKGGKLTEIGKYYSKNDVVSVFVSGKNILDKNTVSGVWIKKDAKPNKDEFNEGIVNDLYDKINGKKIRTQNQRSIKEAIESANENSKYYKGYSEVYQGANFVGSSKNGIFKYSSKYKGIKYDEGGMMAEGGDVDEIKMDKNNTTIRKGFHGWIAKTIIENFKGYDWDISTLKTYDGDLTSTAQAGDNKFYNGYTSFEFVVFQDPSIRLKTSRPARVNEKAVLEQHAEALKIFKEKVGNTPDKEKMADGGAIGFDALAKKVAKNYEGDEVKKEFQDEYGKKYDKKEAEEVGKKVAGKVYRQQQAKGKMAKGGKVDKKNGTPANRSQSKMTLISRKASEIRKANEPWRDAFNRAKVMLYS